MDSVVTPELGEALEACSSTPSWSTRSASRLRSYQHD